MSLFMDEIPHYPNNNSQENGMPKPEGWYADEFQQAKQVKLLAAHGTELEKASIMGIVGKLLPGLSGLLLSELVTGTQPYSSALPNDAVAFSAMEVNPQYSIRTYPQEVVRSSKRPKGEVFIAKPVSEIIEMPGFTGFSDFSQYNYPDFYRHYLYSGENGLLNQLLKRGIELPISIAERQHELDEQLIHGKLKPADYLTLLDISRKVGLFNDRTDDPILELHTKDHVLLGSATRLYMPEDFKPSFIKQVAAIHPKFSNFPKALEETGLDDEVIDPLRSLRWSQRVEEAIDQALGLTVFYSSEIPSGKAALLHYSVIEK